MKPEPDINGLIAFIRKHQGISQNKLISETSLLEKDLGITGDDGCELLEAIEKEFSLSFLGSDGSLREVFGLSDGQYLFHSEGVGLFSAIASLFGRDVENVKAISVGDLYSAISKARHFT